MSVIMLQLGRTSQMRTPHKTHKKGMAVRLLTSGWNTATENLSRFIEIISSNKWGYAMLLKGHHSRTRCNWYFEWTANIKSYEVSVLGCCKYVSQYRRSKRNIRSTRHIRCSCYKKPSTDCLTVCETFHFRFRHVFIKVYILVERKA